SASSARSCSKRPSARSDREVVRSSRRGQGREPLNRFSGRRGRSSPSRHAPMLHTLLRAAAARHYLGWADPEELIDTAHALLDRSFYSYSLGELATLYAPAQGPVDRWFLAALDELRVVYPIQGEAVRVLLAGQFEKIVEGDLPWAEALKQFAIKHDAPQRRKVHDWLARYRCDHLPGDLSRYRYQVNLAEEGYSTEEQTEAVLREMEEKLLVFARDWLHEFSGITVAPEWLEWNDGLVLNLVRTIQAERAFDRLPILADALEEAGCADPILLEHFRYPGPHRCGCWILDRWLEEF